MALKLLSERAVCLCVARRANSIVPCGPAHAANDTERQSSSRLDPLIDHLVEVGFACAG